MEYREAKRVQASLLAAVEKRCLIWIAERLPASITSDHLTALGTAAMLGVGVSYALALAWPWLLLAVIGLLALNWFGDSLDGTLARVRKHERPRYGFYVDHVLDAVGILFLFGGLVLGGFMSPWAGAGFLIAYYLLSIEIALATHSVGVFRISFGWFGPTELRILVACGTLLLLRSEFVTIFGQRVLLFDVGGVVAIAGLLATFVVSALQNTRALYRAEPFPGRAANSLLVRSTTEGTEDTETNTEAPPRRAVASSTAVMSPPVPSYSKHGRVARKTAPVPRRSERGSGDGQPYGGGDGSQRVSAKYCGAASGSMDQGPRRTSLHE